MNLSVYIIAYNEADKIHDCISSVLWADEIIVVDSFSTDGTDEIAKQLGAKIVNVEFNGYGDLRNQAISHCEGDWVLSLDSDERCTEEVRDEILSLIENSQFDIYRIPRKNYFMGRWIKYSGWYPNYRQPQLFRNGKMKYDFNPVHEGFISLSDKDIGTICNDIWQFPFKNTEEVMHKANRYSTLGAKKLKDKGKKGGVFSAFLHGFWSFLKHYIFKLGFLDGGPGFVIAFGNFEGTFYRYIKLTEARANWKTPEVKPVTKPIK
ncbi:MAG: glycosyltransferase family 2 protein [Flavobacteriaceae bacterium]|jgi:glycosyltransferase involved in cell wall biosynthesis|nr:glycosyltransferase family 2 protein [Flavobacteriaceae bacterium]